MSNVSSKVLKASALSLLIKFIQKSLGLISILILARILTPDDFGIVAISALVLHFCDVLSTAGSESYLIQKPDCKQVILKIRFYGILALLIPSQINKNLMHFL